MREFLTSINVAIEWWTSITSETRDAVLSAWIGSPTTGPFIGDQASLCLQRLNCGIRNRHNVFIWEPSNFNPSKINAQTPTQKLKRGFATLSSQELSSS